MRRRGVRRRILARALLAILLVGGIAAAIKLTQKGIKKI